MIAALEGIITEKQNDSVVLSVGGVGFQVYVSPMLISQIELHKLAAFYTYLVVREDSLTLFGFKTLEEKEMFLMLLGVSGVGPKTAMTAISNTSIELIKKAVLNEQPDLLAQVPGIGKKTAQSIVYHLQGKIKGEIEQGKGIESGVDTDVINALTSLGYSLIEAQSALQMIPEDTPEDLESRIRAALKYFF